MDNLAFAAGAASGAALWGMPPPKSAEAVRPLRHADIEPAEVAFQRLRDSADIARIAHLRAEIQLPCETRLNPRFQALEKKEIAQAWSAHSSGAAASSVR